MSPYKKRFFLPGDHSEGETPGPIPNPEVKPFVADDTQLGESRCRQVFLFLYMAKLYIIYSIRGK